MNSLIGWPWVLDRISQEPTGILFSELWVEASKTQIGKEMSQADFTDWMKRRVRDGALQVSNDRLVLSSNQNWWDK